MALNRPRRIGFLFLPGFALMSAAAAVEPLRAANLLSGRPLYEPVFLSGGGGWLHSTVLGAFETLPLAELTAPLDLLFVVAGGSHLGTADRQTLALLARISRLGTPLGGISGGAAILAQAGLMHERRYTAHWRHLDELRESYPEAMIESRLFVIDRDRYTCAGGIAPLDMMHALIAAEHGVALANAVSEWFIHTGIREAAAPQQLDPARSYDLRHPALIATLGLMGSHIADPLTLEDLAELCAISARQLERLAQAHLGTSVMRFYRQLRLEKADEMLRCSGMSIDAIARATGFADRSHFGQRYRAEFGIGPAARRRAGSASAGPAIPA